MDKHTYYPTTNIEADLDLNKPELYLAPSIIDDLYQSGLIENNSTYTKLTRKGIIYLFLKF